ncbi:MAG: lipoate--protein ligase family protein [Candidatus Micrarchaeaceae archaeon]
MEVYKDVSKSAERGRNVSMFGYDVFGAAMNMAIDEAMLELSERTRRSFIRFYNFKRPSIILSSSDHADNIRIENIDGIDVSRRKTGGKPIYLDKNTLSYSITGIGAGSDYFKIPESLHKELGSIIATSIRDMVDPSVSIGLGRYYSIRANGMPIAGHGQLVRASNAFLYHGVIAVCKWDHESINHLLRLVPYDYNSLKSLPSIDSISKSMGMDADYYKEQIIKSMLMGFSENGKADMIGNDDRDAILKRAVELSAEYSDPKYIFRKDGKLKLSSRFCLLWEG